MPRPRSNEKMWKWAGIFALAYVSCAIHDGWRTQRGEHDRCILPTLQAVLVRILRG